ncbi:hypothetical protein FHS92_003241 [Sphingobium subterraneum]|jgi:hypothetical protein|uniref:Secreted protein n=1 Tax=Sphingobium subterraneum TaxID=627688 RepID=A0A841J2R6_9SPHN|nr:hypothetical protein [Sphingobium subterraneum]
MLRRFTLFFLAFVMLFANVHALSWSHDHVGSVVHSLEAQSLEPSHADDHERVDAGPIEQATPLDAADRSGDVPHQHNTPVGLEAAVFDAGFGKGLGRSLSFPAPAARLTSRDFAPPLEPPSA